MRTNQPSAQRKPETAGAKAKLSFVLLTALISSA